jgi:hypothetical protein
MEGSLVAYKVFTNGSTLQASELNENLMQQATAVFSNAAARTAAITSPLEGQLTYLEDVDRYEHYNGSSWVSPFGATLLATTSFTSTTTLDVDNVFSSQFDAYQVVLAVTSSSAVDVAIQFRVGGTTANSLNYDYTLVNAQTSLSHTRVTNSSSGSTGRLDSNGGLHNFTISNPFLTQRTYINSQSIDSATFVRVTGTAHTLATSYTGFRLTMSSSTGNIRVYGLRK